MRTLGKIDWWWYELPDEKRGEIEKECFPVYDYSGKIYIWDDLSIDRKIGVWRQYAEWDKETLGKIYVKLEGFVKNDIDFQHEYQARNKTLMTFEESVTALMDDIKYSENPLMWMQPDWYQGGSWYRPIPGYYVDIDNVWDSYITLIKDM